MEYTLALYEKAIPSGMTFEEMFRITKECGFDRFEISIDETDVRLSRLDMTPEEQSALGALARRMGTPIRTMCLSGHRKYPFGSHDPEVRKKSMEIMRKAVDLSVNAGISIIQLAGYDVYYEPHSEETEQRFVENIRRLERVASCAGVQLGFETMENEFMNTVEKAMHYIGLVNSNYLKIYPDIGNTTNAAVLHGTDPIEDLKKGRGQLLALHLKETCPEHYREIPYGTGHVDFEAAVRTAWELGVRRYVTEFWYKEGGETPKEVRARFGELLDRQH